MFAQVLQIAGFLGTYVLVILYYVLTGRSFFPGVIAFALTVHFVGDYFRGFLKRDDPIVLAGFNLSEMLQPVYFLLWVGIAMQMLGHYFLLSRHAQWGSVTGSLGTAFAVTGFVGSIIYKPRSDIRW
jgi:hypothetical protein